MDLLVFLFKNDLTDTSSPYFHSNRVLCCNICWDTCLENDQLHCPCSHKRYHGTHDLLHALLYTEATAHFASLLHLSKPIFSSQKLCGLARILCLVGSAVDFKDSLFWTDSPTKVSGTPSFEGLLLKMVAANFRMLTMLTIADTIEFLSSQRHKFHPLSLSFLVLWKAEKLLLGFAVVL